MELKEFIEHFAEQLDETDVSEIKPDTKFRDLDEWSSLVALGLMAMIDDEYDISLKADEMRRANTIQELFDLVKNKQ
ncbi:putative acyl carrier protein [Parabacteroides distasonis]|jgi:putative acyl carrier protein|uniref:Putative acyl carrier protein n=1 Tax=Parabacteroides distasonis (strain ATCC 8503 / DSM 20701 / CIP 104284 / JCM 5825 / NCTC 11152) TaxID=435591 RepID=A6L9H7_PARD8|nr:acyl carrier protein [Parabacteroides distasonis]ABR42341.1 putative acyl carrier protein [Parabacteroides distasonis ATCC 8503]PNL09235.1 acyl carrier protein [Parabacteroides distasonis]QRO17462.1 acyl carrier protein [Parabacteroides distasonis]UEB11821.1 acyl carrier protein [Parabacteroides distasonis]SUV27975.1 putative acyl carrier protein [Parabacteroides distasonis]